MSKSSFALSRYGSKTHAERRSRELASHPGAAWPPSLSVISAATARRSYSSRSNEPTIASTLAINCSTSADSGRPRKVACILSRSVVVATRMLATISSRLVSTGCIASVAVCRSRFARQRHARTAASRAATHWIRRAPM